MGGVARIGARVRTPPPAAQTVNSACRPRWSSSVASSLERQAPAQILRGDPTAVL